jgi:hypothetical protein
MVDTRFGLIVRNGLYLVLISLEFISVLLSFIFFMAIE